MKWINFLHIYQPPWQSKDVVDRIAKETYFPLTELLGKLKRGKVTLNINASLAELFDQYGYKKLLKKLSSLAKRGQVEFVSSAAYHAFLPLLPEREIKRQIDLNNHLNKKYFGKAYRPVGFFSPEMGMSDRLARLLGRLGYRYALADVSSLPYRQTAITPQLFYYPRGKLNILFSDHNFSDQVSALKKPTEYLKLLQRQARGREYYATASDGELYGHHNPQGVKMLAAAFANRKITPILARDFAKAPAEDLNKPLREASWSTRPGHVRAGNNYPLWDDNTNRVHKYLWRLAKLAMTQVAKHSKDRNYYWARRHLDRGLASCTWWWAAALINWNPEEIEKGSRELIKSIRSLRSLSRRDKIAAEKIYSQLGYEIWKMHWSGEANSRQRRSVLIK